MQQGFNAKAATAEQTLEQLGIDYQRRDDGTLFVPGNLALNGRGLATLPDLSRVEVGGTVWCSDNHLRSLLGSPYKVGGSFYCTGNGLVTLEGAPQSVSGGFYCQDNNLPSLAGGPKEVGGTFSGFRNKLESLEGVPQKFNWICSDFGGYKTGGEVPQRHRPAAPTAAA
jgi:hypothetical protein